MCQDPGLYVCKSCSDPRILTDNARSELKKGGSADNNIFVFSSDMHRYMTDPVSGISSSLAAIEKSVDAKLAVLEEKLTKSFQTSNSSMHLKFDSFAAAAKASLPPKFDRPRHVAAERQHHKADPKKSILISKMANQKEFGPTSIRSKLESLRPGVSDDINFARLLNSGKLLIEARNPAARDSLLTGWPKDAFGAAGQISAMDAVSDRHTKGWCAVTKIDRCLFTPALGTAISEKYTSLTHCTRLNSRHSSPTRYLSLKYTFANESDFKRALTDGFYFQMQHFRMTPFVHAPTRCYNCHRLGHVAAVCRSPKRCMNCGSTDADHPSPCVATASCVNCGGSHSAAYRNCPCYLDALEKVHKDSVNG